MKISRWGFCGLFNNTVSISEYAASNGRIITIM
jgi:hypothetical protein